MNNATVIAIAVVASIAAIAIGNRIAVTRKLLAA